MDHVDADGVVAFTQELVRVRSVHEPASGAAEGVAAGLVEARMRSFGWSPTVVEVAPGRPSVIAVLEGAGPGPTLMFEGHTDVVTEGDRSEWSFDPYCGDIVDGRLLGRGSADMKSGVAAMLYAARAVELTGFAGRIVVGALVDEEGMMLGAKAFAASELAATVDGVIVCEPEDGEICAVSKGAIRLRITVTGRMAHGAMPQHGRNPVPVVAAIIGDLGILQDRLLKQYGEHEHLGANYLTATVIEAGNADQINVIPRTATVCVDIRTTTAVSHPDLVEQITQIAAVRAKAAETRADVEVIDDRPPVDTPVDHPVVVALAAAHEAVTGRPPVYGGVPGATDGTILTRDAGLATVVYGPGDKWIAHQADEWVGVEDIVTCTRVYAEAAQRFLTRSSP